MCRKIFGKKCFCFQNTVVTFVTVEYYSNSNWLSFNSKIMGDLKLHTFQCFPHCNVHELYYH